MNPEDTFHAGLSGVPYNPTPMNPIDIIKEVLEAARAAVWDGHYSKKGVVKEYAQCIDKDVSTALTALDSLTVKVSDEEIERIAEAVIPPFTGMATAHSLRIEHQHEGALKALRHARDKWLQ